MRFLLALTLCLTCAASALAAANQPEANAVTSDVYGRAERLQTDVKPASILHQTFPLSGLTVLCSSVLGGSGNGNALGTFSSGQFNIQVVFGCSDITQLPVKCKVRQTFRVKGKFKFTTPLLLDDVGTIKSRGTFRQVTVFKGVDTAIRFSIVDDVEITDVDTGDVFPGHFGLTCKGDTLATVICVFDTPVALDCAALGAP
jgi:hypothetical protein